MAPGEARPNLLPLVASKGCLPAGASKRGMASVKESGPYCCKHHVGGSGIRGSRRTSSFYSSSRTPGHQGCPGEALKGVCSGLVGRGRDRSAFSSHKSLPLLKNVYGPQTRRKKETHNRLVSLQQKVEKAGIPHGGSPYYRKNHIPGSLGSKIGSEGCLLQHPPLSRDLEVFSVCSRRGGGQGNILFQSASLWPHNSSLGLHKSYEGSQESSSSSGNSVDFISGRLPHPGSFLRGGSGSYYNNYRSSSKAGLSDKLGKVFQGTSEIPGVPGGYSELGGHDFFPSRGKDSENPVFLQGWPEGLEAYKKGFRETRRFLQLRGPVFTLGQAFPEAHCSVDESQHFSCPEGSLRSSRRLPQRGSPSMDGSRLPQVSHSNKAASIFKDPHDGRFLGRLERSSPSTFSKGSLAYGVGGHVHELEGAEGCAPVTGQVSGPVEGSLRQSPVRQHNGFGLHSKGGFTGLEGSLGSVQRPAIVCSVQGHHTFPSSSARKVECLGRQGIEEQSDQYRMDSGPQFLHKDLRGLGSSSSGPVCHKGKLPVTSVRLSLPGSLGSGLRCSQRQPGLESVEVTLPISSFSAYRGGFVEAEDLRRFRLLGNAILANGSLVRALREEVSFQDPPPRRGLLVPDVFRDHILPQVPFNFQASRLETIRAAILKEGLNDYSVRVLCRCHKVSTINQYQGVWSKFLLYLTSQKILHHEIKVNHIINFLSYCSEHFNLAYKTIAVYKNALRLPLLFSLGLNLDCPLVIHYMLGLHAIKPPPSHGFMPPWDLSDLLLFLQSNEFYPLESCSFMRLSQKTLALILLASGRRIHEISSLSRDFRRSGDKVILFWPKDFRAKNYRVGHYPEHPSIRKMSHYFAGPRDLRNCPVETWKVYTNRRALVTNESDDSNFWTFIQVSFHNLQVSYC